jgi:hypothetical protein
LTKKRAYIQRHGRQFAPSKGVRHPYQRPDRKTYQAGAEHKRAPNDPGGYFMRRRRGGDSTYLLLDNRYVVDDGDGPFAMTEELLDRASDAVEALDQDDYQRHISRVLMEYYDPGEEPAAFVDRILTRADIHCTAEARARAIRRLPRLANNYGATAVIDHSVLMTRRQPPS